MMLQVIHNLFVVDAGGGEGGGGNTFGANLVCTYLSNLTIYFLKD